MKILEAVNVALVVKLMKDLNLNKKEHLCARFTPARIVALAAACLLLLFTPLWRETVQTLLESERKVVIRAVVPGTVEEVYAEEGQQVVAGGTLAHLRNLKLESEAAQVTAQLQVASARATQAGLRYTGFGAAEREREQLVSGTTIWPSRLRNYSSGPCWALLRLLPRWKTA